MKSTAVAAGDTAAATQYNNLRQDAQGASTLLATQQAAPVLTLLIQAGSIFFGTTKVDYAGGNTPAFTAPVGNPRIDLVYITSGGVITVLQGTPAGSPVAPTTPAGAITICHVYMRVSTTAIYDTDQTTNGYILRDIRPFLLMPTDVGASRQVFTATGAGTWTKPSSGTIARIRVWGAGGGGGRGTSGVRSGGGGGGGACVEKWVLLSALGATESVSVGTGGTGGAVADTAGTAGGNTTFGGGGTLITSYGGAGGIGNAAGGGGGGGGGTEGAGAAGASTAGGNGGIPRGYNIATSTSTSRAGTGGAVNNPGAAGDQAGGGGGGGGGGNIATADIRNGGSGTFGGGGGGGGADSGTVGAGGDGGRSIYGGGGGGGSGVAANVSGDGGISLQGGNGGAANWSTNAATAGSQPAGGGGGSENAVAGNGGAGQVEVVVF